MSCQNWVVLTGLEYDSPAGDSSIIELPQAINRYADLFNLRLRPVELTEKRHPAPA